uniref:Cytochrome b n=1 Tax=Bosea sp. NBC_00436 TaxID=2969620 RepID=A0A9E7ZLM8_9HYPH
MRPRNWHPLLILLHWATVVLIALQYGLAWVMDDETRDLLSRFALYQWHKSFGLTLAGLVLLRLATRLLLPAPAPPTMPRWQHIAAAAVQGGLYLCLLAMPVTGFLMAAAAPIQIPTLFFGLFSVPHPIGPDQTVYDAMLRAHATLFDIMAALAFIHAGAALLHQFVLRDGLMRRMWFGRP